MYNDKLKIYADKEKLIESELMRIKDILSKILDKLPNEELPFMEPHLRSLYFEVYFLLAEGFYNASLVLMGILLESVAKEKLFLEGIKDEELEKMDFGKTLTKIKNSISNKEFDFFNNRRYHLRNPYAHYNKMKLSEGVYFKGWKIPYEKLLDLVKKVSTEEISKEDFRKKLIEGEQSEMISSKELRPLAHLAKNEVEKSQAINIFLEIDKFIRGFAEKYFKPKN